MAIDKWNQWLVLVANISVLIGIIIVALELRQTNRIALRDARSEIVEFTSANNLAVVENPGVAEIWRKLRYSEQLDDLEIEQLNRIITQQLNLWSLVRISYEADLIADISIRGYIQSAVRNIETYPAYAPYLAERVSGVFAEGPIGEAVAQKLSELGYESDR